ncbi:phage holin [Agathobaculum sp. NTUH-O15-33]|uniref:phage holin n=1 Tax=Agathobaculum sp. NTUH-O15-33 TaxID=3079302 RepID=UPI0029586295|nr:phage holin [Agathobaculum sp. NTUH-O15-33]WNX83409.1 phage holin [Agathobaculum sp. NTUH-O15-33]
MNWKLRLRNPVVWVQITLGAFATALAYGGLTAASMVTWADVWNVVVGAAKSPYCLFVIVSNIWNALNDPTTPGMADCRRVMELERPQARS